MAGLRSGKSSYRIPGCAITMALAGLAMAVFFVAQPDRQAAPAPTPLAAAAQPAGQQTGRSPQFPALNGRVVDAANIIPADTEARITQKLEALELATRHQLVVTTLPDLQGYEISDYGYQLGRAWGIGSKDKSDGALLIVAPVERKLRIEVGYGLEGILTDGLSSIIINETIVPKFKAGDMAGGIEAGTDALVRQLGLPEGEARIIAAQARPAPQDAADVDNLFFYAIAFLFFLSFILPMIRRTKGGRRYTDAIAPVIVWDALSNVRSGGGGWSGGGGFSGGGGSFGGGGSSGSW